MTEQYIFNFQIMTNTKLMRIFYWLLLVLPQSISLSSKQGKTHNEKKIYPILFFSCLVQFMSFCNQAINISTPLSIIFTPNSLSSSTCCNITLDKSSLSNTLEQIIININNMSDIVPALKIFNKQMQSIDLINYSVLNRTYVKTDIIDLPVTFSLCQLNIQTFEMLITNISKGIKKECFIVIYICFSIGPCISNQYRCLTSNQEQWCIDDTYHCDGYHSCPQGIDELGCPSMKKINFYFGPFLNENFSILFA